MGGRGTFAAGKSVSYTYGIDTEFSPDGKFYGVKVLKGKSKVLHYHVYGKEFSKNEKSSFSRTTKVLCYNE